MASSLDDLYHESNFHCISSLTTIYGSTVINGLNCPDKLLVSMLKGKILSFGYKKVGQSLVKAEREVSFTYIPADANVVAIDCFTCDSRGLIIGVAFYKETNGKQTNYLNIYCNYTFDASSKGELCELEKVAENCRPFELEFVPFQLTHCKSRARKERKDLQTVFILLGGDCQVHVYAQDDNQGEFLEENLDNYFPEFLTLPGVPMFVDVKIAPDEKQRFSAIGHATGDISLFVTDLTAEDWTTSSYHIQHDSPITCVRFFTKKAKMKMPEFMRGKFKYQHDVTAHEPDFYHLLVTSAWESAVVYCFCCEQGFSLPILLDKSSDHDCVTCCAISDIDRDGANDIIIGTYGQDLMVYKFKETLFEIGAEYDPCNPVVLTPSWSRSFSYPVINLSLQDLTGDGLNEIVVMTTKGLHVLQSDPKLAIEECKRKLLQLKKLKIK